jgi:hypothetical protein
LENRPQSDLRASTVPFGKGYLKMAVSLSFLHSGQRQAAILFHGVQDVADCQKGEAD